MGARMLCWMTRHKMYVFQYYPNTACFTGEV